jgi:transposase InsO family protein
MIRPVRLLLDALRSTLRSRGALVLENLVLRQQLAAFAHAGRRPRVTTLDRWFWVVQQLREAFPFATAPRHLIFDRDACFSAWVVATVRSFGIQPTRTGWQSPWQNGVAERWVGSVRRELLDHVVVLGERHLRRLLVAYVAYYHHDRTHLGLGKATPTMRPAERRPDGDAEIISRVRVGGLHHRYEWRAAA